MNVFRVYERICSKKSVDLALQIIEDNRVQRYKCLNSMYYLLHHLYVERVGSFESTDKLQKITRNIMNFLLS